MLDPQREIQALVDTFVDDLSELAKRIAIEQIKAAFEFGAPSLPPYSPASGSASSSASSSSSSSSASASGSSRTASASGNGVAASPPTGRRGRRASQDLQGLRERLLGAISEQPGRRTEDLNAALGTETGQIAPLLRKLVSEQAIRTEGARRGTRYFAMSAGASSEPSGQSESAQLPLV